MYKSHVQGKEYGDAKRNRTKSAHVNSTGIATTVNLANITMILTCTIGVVSSASVAHFILYSVKISQLLLVIYCQVGRSL
jgi:hypothetical protein